MRIARARSRLNRHVIAITIIPRMMRRVRATIPILLLLITGCAATHEPSQPIATPITTPVAEPSPDQPADVILIQFKTLDCVCHLGNVDFALLQLPGVATVEWNVEQNNARLIFMDERRPTDDSIRSAIADSGVEIISIARPATRR